MTRLNLEMLESMPDRTVTLAISRSRAFRGFQRSMGKATARLNTAIVGLELVAAGGDRPVELGVKWTKPATPELARQTADQARDFIVTAALVYAADSIDSFLRELARESCLAFPKEVVFIAAKEGAPPGGGEFSIRRRAIELCNNLGLVAEPLVSMVDLLVRWRNKAVHTSGSERRHLDPCSRENLVGQKAHLREKYAGVDIERTIASFEAGAHPSKKDTTVFLAACQNFARLLDEAAIRRATPDSAAVDSLAVRLLSDLWSSDSSGGWRSFCGIWDAPEAERVIRLAKVLRQVGISEAKEPISPPVSRDFVQNFAKLTRDAAAKCLGLVRPPD
jgi:hypothetical protein